MKRFLLALIIFNSTYNLVLCQDILIKRNGEQVKTRVLKVTKKEVIYKNYDDPEFNTYSINEKELDKLKPEKGREYWFNHKLPRAYIGINAGVSIAVGSFSTKSYDNASSEPGFAKAGPNINIEAGFYILKRLGLHFKTGVSANEFDRYSWANNYRTNESDQINVSADQNWSFGYLTFGPMYSVKLAKWLTWDNKLFVGFIASSKPYYQVDIVNSAANTHLDITSEESSKTDGCYGLGTTFRFSPVKRLGLLLSVEYRNSSGTQHPNETINGFVEGVNVNSNSNPTSLNSNKSYSNAVINVTAGVAIQFNRKRR